ncbi:MAG: DUF4169 family protein [Rhodobacteraceae bacterium]|nr:DUF4169 family protein [Paracoccaceae bacterium]
MGETVNLRQARKTRERAKKRAAADANAARHGQGKAEKSLAQARADKARALLDAHRRDPGPREPGDGE